MRKHDRHHQDPPPAPPEPAGGAAESLPEACAADPEIERLGRDLAACQDRTLRLQAEFDNFRKRQQREREEVHRQAKERILAELLPVVDNLERALRHAGGEAAGETLAQGVDLVLKQVTELLGRFGGEPVAALGAAFDPHRHEAMARVATSGDPADGTVVEEYRRGWLLDGKVLRPALVAVAKIAPDGGEDGS